tara:strand:+ start:1298 stop:2284 length:987 start_codon:yes stop_codon:yes gene_type:complete
MKTALITGGLGFIGAHIAIDLLKNKKVKRCILLDNFGGYINPTKKNFYDFRKKRLDLIKNKVIERCDTSNFKSVFEIIKKHQPEIIFHTAALPLAKLDNLNTDEAKIGSVDSTINILDAITLLNKVEKKYKCKRFIYLSSSMVYGDFKTKQVNEKSPVNPKEAYGTMKLAGEIITKGISRLNNIPYTIIRPSAVYGPTDMNRRVSQIFIESAFKDKLIEIEGKNEKLDFTFIEDLAKGCVLAGTKKKGINQTFNITYGKGQTLYSYVINLKRFFPNLKFKIKPKDITKPSRGTLSINKARKLLNFNPKYNLRVGIKKYVEYLIQNKIY